MIKKIILIIGLGTTAFLIYCIYLFHSPVNLDELNFIHRTVAKSVFDSWDKYLTSIPKDISAIVDFDTLMNQLNFAERNFAERVFQINPREIGFKGPKYSKEKPGRLVKIESVKAGEKADPRATAGLVKAELLIDVFFAPRSAEAAPAAGAPAAKPEAKR